MSFELLKHKSVFDSIYVQNTLEMCTKIYSDKITVESMVRHSIKPSRSVLRIIIVFLVNTTILRYKLELQWHYTIIFGRKDAFENE